MNGRMPNLKSSFCIWVHIIGKQNSLFTWETKQSIYSPNKHDI